MKTVLLAFAASALIPAGAALSQPVARSPSLGQAPPAASPLDMNGARLGMTLEAWKALSYKSGPTSQLTPSCSAASDSGSGVQRGQTSRGSDGLVCFFAQRYGHTDLQQAFPLTSAFLARAPTYVFVNGRLSQIEFRTSVDAFNYLDARFTARFGSPVRTLRDNLAIGPDLKVPRVRREWRDAREDLWIIDPSPRSHQLVVRYSAANTALSPPQS